ncbi:MAG: hypothetical protein J5I57_05475 [Melioribacteraceae bacterium]|nr:hypothetical protein [Melioribacteraceae bacterium]
MNLIPIVYTSLLIFVAVTFVVIVVSFIIYKLRNRNDIYVKKHELRPIVKKSTNEDSDQRIANPQRQENYLKNPVPEPRYSTREVPAPVYLQSEYRPNSTPNKPVQRIEMLRESRPRESYTQTQNTRPQISKVRVTNPEDRFRVLNNPIQSENGNANPARNYSGGGNMMNYYANDDLACFPPVYFK